MSHPHITPEPPSEPLPGPGAPPPAPEPDPQPGEPPAPPPGGPIPDEGKGLLDLRRLRPGADEQPPGVLGPPRLDALEGPTEACEEPDPDQPALPIG